MELGINRKLQEYGADCGIDGNKERIFGRERKKGEN